MFTPPKTWKDLEEVVANQVLESLPTTFKRSAATTAHYEQDRARISRETALSNLKAEIQAASKSLDNGIEVAITVNRYPYDELLKHLPNVTHVLLWFKGELSLESAKQYLQSLGLHCCLYENPEALKSYPEISHYQVFQHVLDN